ncbi:transposase IS66 [Caballeronia calidae]|uniref:Transposase IS66 n=1 Tax=Caballeronia calidae TaxID=1777139 RepID=A0A158EEK3_9BURK|nr:transposase IS66 [Caballeronia calidae]
MIRCKPGLAAQALQWIAQLYAIESRINHQTPDIKHAARQAEALPVLAKFRQWLEGNVIGLQAQAPLAKAIGYALRHWQALIRYTESGVLLPDNNALERQIRPIVLGRVNWTFAGSPRGARATAIMYSLLGTARLNGLLRRRVRRSLRERRPCDRGRQTEAESGARRARARAACLPVSVPRRMPPSRPGTVRDWQTRSRIAGGRSLSVP